MGQLTPEQLDILRIAQHSTLRMLELVNAILDVSRLESGRMPLELEAFSLTELLSETLDSQTTLANEKGIRLELNAPTTLPPAWADVKLIQRVLQNLIGNAIKFTPSGGTVCVTARTDERADRPLLLVSVSDTGLGIPSEIQSRLFQRFVAGTQEERGSGLGLAFCKLALEAHGERIWMASTPGNGTTFTFSLPVATPLPTPTVSDL
jgi:signal transduction histidine kinase